MKTSLLVSLVILGFSSQAQAKTFCQSKEATLVATVHANNSSEVELKIGNSPLLLKGDYNFFISRADVKIGTYKLIDAKGVEASLQTQEALSFSKLPKNCGRAMCDQAFPLQKISASFQYQGISLSFSNCYELLN